MTLDINRHLETRREQVNQQLRHLLRFVDGCPEALRAALEYSLLAPGKRLRPLLTLLAVEAAGGNVKDALSAGCAVEMVHAYSLIHDDLPAMDDDDLRRGLPTCHKKFGEALAILAGDALLTLAFQVLATDYPAATASACCRELAVHAGSLGMVGGQVDDLTWEGKISGLKVPDTLDGLARIHNRKTGALFAASLRLGLFVAHGPEPEARLCELLDGYARCLGLAFQITDDLLDVEGNEAKAGKGVGKDAVRGKLTYPGLLGIEASRERAEQLCREAEETIAPLGARAEPLAALVRTIVMRDR